MLPFPYFKFPWLEITNYLSQTLLLKIWLDPQPSTVIAAVYIQLDIEIVDINVRLIQNIKL